jgi:hypothetical protein
LYYFYRYVYQISAKKKYKSSYESSPSPYNPQY